jgi:hypothetical protein
MMLCRHAAFRQALEAEERKTLELFLRRLAAAGQLDASDVREGLQAHGLEGAFRIAVNPAHP